MVKIYKILTLTIFISIGCMVVSPTQAREVTLRIKSLSTGTPVANAVVDLQSCHIGKFLTDKNGVVSFDVNHTQACVLYISSSGYITLVRSFEVPTDGDNLEMVFYMQKQDQYKMGRLLSSSSFIPIAHAQIFHRMADGKENLIGLSDKDGRFGLVNYNSGQYHLIFRHPDYHTQERTIFVRRTDGGLGSFYMDGEKKNSITVEEKSPKLTGISSKKFSFLSVDKKYIIVLGLFKGREHLPENRVGVDIQFVEKGDWIRMFIGPYDNEREALTRLTEVKKRYPQAILKIE